MLIKIQLGSVTTQLNLLCQLCDLSLSNDIYFDSVSVYRRGEFAVAGNIFAAPLVNEGIAVFVVHLDVIVIDYLF